MSKFRIGQKCRVAKNLLAPHCIGYEVMLLGVAVEKDGNVIYKIDMDGLKGYAAENCLIAIK